MSEDHYDQFIEGLCKAISDCLDRGYPARLTAGNEKRMVTIDVYSTPEQVQELERKMREVVTDPKLRVQAMEAGKDFLSPRPGEENTGGK